MTEYIPLNKVCTAIVDCPHETPEWKDDGIPVIRNFNLIDGQINMQDGYYVDEETYNKRTKRAVPSEGDIIFSREAPIGNCAIVPRDFKCCLGQRLVLLKVKHSVCSSEYLLTVLQSSYVRQQIDQVSKRGSIVSNFAIEDLQNLMIPVLDNQDDIATISSTIAMSIANNSSICTTLESMAKLLYDYWFVQFDFPDENGKPYKSSGGKMVWNEELKREIPEGWGVDTLGSIIKLERGISYSSEHLEGNGIPMINLGSFAIGGGYKDGNLKTYNGDYTDQKIIKPYDLLICLTQQTSIDPSKDVIGCAMTVPDIFDNDIVISQDLAKLVCSEEVKFYLFQYFNTTYFHKYITGFASGSNILHLDVNGILIHKSVIPAQEILMEYSRIVRNVWEKHSRCIRENQQLASLRDFLLPMLMNGQVKVGDAKNN